MVAESAMRIRIRFGISGFVSGFSKMFWIWILDPDPEAERDKQFSAF
jgi:hypothetical protein